jgi:hypothetical protein
VLLWGTGLAAEAVIAPPSFDLGDVPYGASVTRTVLVSNTGDAPLRVASWTASDGALAIAPSGVATVQPGAAAALTLVFDSLKTKCDGLYDGSLELESNSLTPGRITVTANVRGLEVIGGELDFGPLAIGASRTLSATLINRATLPLTLTATLAGAPQFRIGTLPAQLLAAGASTDVPVTYRPTPGRWSPFGDHAMLTGARPGCEATCSARVHLIGNIGAQVVPGGGVSPTLAVAGDTLHVASVANGVAYAVRSGSGAWSQESDPTEGAAGQPALVAGPDGTLAILWHETELDVQHLNVRQRTAGGDWGPVCSQVGQRSGWGPLALDGAGAVWSTWADLSTNSSQTGPLVSDAGVCQAGQAPSIEPLDAMEESNLVIGPDGLLRLAGRGLHDRYLWLVILDPASGIVDYGGLAANVNPEGGPAQTVGADGSWHVVWPGDAYFYEHLDLVGTDQAHYAYTRGSSGFVEVVPLMRESSQANGMRLVVDSMDRVHIAWSDLACANPGQRKLYYVTGRPSIFYGGWQAIDVTTPGYTGADPSLAMVIEDDRLVAAWGVSASGSGELLVGEAGVGARAATDVVTATITPGQGGSLVAPDGRVEVQFPAGSVTEVTTVTYTRRPRPAPALGNFLFAGLSFALEAHDSSGAVNQFGAPFTLALRYDDAGWQAAGIQQEEALNVYFWDGNRWQALLPCDGCSLDTAANTLTVRLDHLTEFALLGRAAGSALHLPMVGKTQPSRSQTGIANEILFLPISGSE